ncbi:DAK2 domain-containing protein [Citricoccus sp. I39-566]|uniref:DAK2 domain-containing protein n=1 Tax=Citricoccus sp. I39-566 TaxID=3073268 RepID=UPI00286A0A5D|nr:DAK2 domain-containing protein [Citricoccus sp. I39-566]WMY77056.1 DAK2 domain-containing protein [Citricoccus sp. I39-566]
MTSHETPPRAPSRVHQWLELAETVVGNASDRMDAMNIFPVPDGDTGSNLYGTVRAARAAVAESATEDVGVLLATAGRAALDQARGNSGTLLAVMLLGMSEPLNGHERLAAPTLAAALDRARTSCWAALSDPQDGTMLSVLGAAAQAAGEYAAGLQGQPEDQVMSRRELGAALDAVVDATWQAVVQTEGQLPALSEANVVDAGGVGLMLILDSLRATVMGTRIDPGLLDGLHGFAASAPHIHTDRESTVGYELMCSIDLDPLTAATLRFELNEIGDSVIMSPLGSAGDGPAAGPGSPTAPGHGDPENHGEDGSGSAVRWRLHVHVDDHEAAEALVRKAGTPENLVVTSLQDGSSQDGSSQDEGRQDGEVAGPGASA